MSVAKKIVDQAIVTSENIERHLHMGKPLIEAIEVGADEIGVPAFVSTLCICIVFVPMFFLSGVAKFLFIPLAEAVVFAMLVSFFLSRSFVPTMVKLLMNNHDQNAHQEKKPPNAFEKIYIQSSLSNDLIKVLKTYSSKVKYFFFFHKTEFR